ncbi:MAG: hypothetical protein H6815_09335 [Phycisphaeraceae bacterium]|nr:hypothetical protein [Phycisphaerales bacterium]MCB9860640.1 hypothetical protein [Phycisphaeraceae bacterium]
MRDYSEENEDQSGMGVSVSVVIVLVTILYSAIASELQRVGIFPSAEVLDQTWPVPDKGTVRWHFVAALLLAIIIPFGWVCSSFYSSKDDRQRVRRVLLDVVFGLLVAGVILVIAYFAYGPRLWVEPWLDVGLGRGRRRVTPFTFYLISGLPMFALLSARLATWFRAS